MERWFEIIEAEHQLQNPTSADKIRLLGETLRLDSTCHVLDMGAGQAGPAILLAHEFGCRVTAVERSESFVTVARRRVQRAGVDGLVTLVQADGSRFSIDDDQYDSALCLGASFIWGGLEPTVGVLSRGVRSGGFVVVGEPYWRRWPLPTGYEPEEGYEFASLSETATRFESAGIELITLIASSEDDWDRYVSKQWSSLERWLREDPDAPEAEGFRTMGRDERDLYLRWHRDLLGWAIFVGRKS